MARINDGESPADFCRRMGWGPGTVVTYMTHLPGVARRVTAVGVREVLSRHVHPAEAVRYETITNFGYHDWSEVPTPPVTLMDLARVRAGKDGAPC